MSQNFLHRQQCIAEGITVFLGNLLRAAERTCRFLADFRVDRRSAKEPVTPQSGRNSNGKTAGLTSEFTGLARLYAQGPVE